MAFIHSFIVGLCGCERLAKKRIYHFSVISILQLCPTIQVNAEPLNLVSGGCKLYFR